LVAAIAITLAYGTLGFFVLDRQYSINFTVWAAARQTLTMFALFYNPVVEPVTRLGRFFEGSIYVVGAATLGFALFMLLRPVLPRGAATPADRRRAKAIAERWAHTPLATIALLPDKRYFFTESGSFVAFRIANRVALALGDPIGPASDVTAAIRAFSDECRRNDWVPAFYQTQPDYLDAYHAAGMSASKIGHDAVVDVRSFSLSGRRFRVERNLMNRLSNEGYVTRHRPAPQTALVLPELRDVSDAWLAAEGGSEMSFSLGWFDDEYVSGSAVLTVEGPEGQIEAFANVITLPATGEASIDLMRYRPSAPDGVMDFLFIRLIEWARENGFTQFNLGFSALSGVGESQDPAVERALRLVYEYGNRFYSFKGLYAFKQKFRPEWRPRYLTYPDASTLPGVLTALVRANGGESEASGWNGYEQHVE
jgi:phosphatidylglycerol lysyltransferase